jgi:hypothetical protein
MIPHDFREQFESPSDGCSLKNRASGCGGHAEDLPSVNSDMRAREKISKEASSLSIEKGSSKLIWSRCAEHRRRF